MFESAISLNFDAVSLLRCGRLDDSIYLLKSVLSVVQTAEVPEFSQAVIGPQGRVVSVPLDGDPHDDCIPKLTPRVSSNLFNRAFIFEGHQSLANTDENASLCASVGLYNMALTLQMKGLTTEGPTCLAKAAGLYQKVFSILQVLAPEPTHSVSSLLLATVLNLVACESELRGYPPARPWMNVFRNLFAWATRLPEAALLQQPEEVEIFAATSVFFASGNLCAAAAA